MLVRRRIVHESAFLAALADNQIDPHDPRIEAVEWYVRHSVRFEDARKVGDTGFGPLLCYRTRRIGRTPPVTVYFYLRDGGSTVCLAGMMCPRIEDE
ncbi:MAG: hypothetical protein KDK70_25590 [Myxococcales bacterium]|nr:hypothetical protein [Myxococcales bacterium]